MKGHHHVKSILLLGLVPALAAILAGCTNPGISFLEDVNQTACCFSPALVLAPGALALLIFRKPHS